MKDFLTMAVITAMCLASKSSRNFGLICLGLLYLAYPTATLGTLLLVGVAYLYFKEK